MAAKVKAAVSTNSIFKGDMKSLSAIVDKAIRSAEETYNLLHVAAVSTLWHAAQHGQCAPLQKLYNGLNINDRMSFKQYCVRTQRNNPEKDLLGSGNWLKFVQENDVTLDGKFAVINDRIDERRTFVALAEELIKAPSLPAKGARWLRFYQRENIQEARDQRIWGDANILTSIHTISKTIAEGDTDTRKVQVSDGVASMVARFEKEVADYIAKQKVSPEKSVASTARIAAAKVAQAPAKPRISEATVQ